MKLNMKTSALIAMYSMAWPIALPVLACSKRMREGWRERLLIDGPEGPVDIWIQAASAGEAYLAREILLALPDDKPLRVLLTSGTSQGMDILDAACKDAEAKTLLATRQAFFPLDAPWIMRRAMERFNPRVLVTLETELWPGMLSAAKRFEIPVISVNGRMSANSFAGYHAARKILRALAPERILAIAGSSEQRFSLVFGADKVEGMNNIKFDRCPTTPPTLPDDHPVKKILGGKAPMALFGSVRQEEEPDVLRALTRVHKARPGTTLTIFPRHMHRLDFWAKALYEAGLPVVLRSQLTEAPPAGTTILWDTFGELGAAYGFARAAFVGGSLRPLGGQNFLEPLIHGVTPIIGRHWKNFDWIGHEILKTDLVYEVADADDLADRMVKNLNRPKDRETVQRLAAEYITLRKGGTAQAVACIARYL